MSNINIVFHSSYKMVQAIKKFGFPVVQTIGKPNKIVSILSTIGKPNTLGKLKDPDHSNSECVWYSSPHCTTIIYINIIFNCHIVFHSVVENKSSDLFPFSFNLKFAARFFTPSKRQMFPNLWLFICKACQKIITVNFANKFFLSLFNFVFNNR